MFVDLLRLLLDTLAALLGSVLLLRAYMHWLGMRRRDPLSQFAYALTDWLVLPLQKLLPLRGRIDWASILGALVVALAFLMAMVALSGLSVFWPALPWQALLLVVRWTLYLVMWTTILYAVLSWVNPDAPMAPALAMLVRPFLAPIRRVLPTVGGVDLSPLVLIVLVNAALFVLARGLF